MPLNVQLHQLPVQNQQLWVWHVLPEVSKIDESTLRAERWEPLDPTALPYPVVALMSQFASMLSVLSSNKTMLKTWIRTDDLQAVSAHPVILAFRQEQRPEQHPAALFHPPLGEIGIVDEDGQIYLYEIAMLGEKGSAFAAELRQAMNEGLGGSLSETWGAAQRAAQRLGALYWDLHVRQKKEAYAQDRQLSLVQEKKPERRRHRPAAGLVLRNPPAIQVSTDILSQILMRSLLSQDEYTLHPELSLAEHRHLSSQEGNVTITIRPGSQETWSQVLESLALLGDAVVDTFCSLISLAHEAHPGDLSHPFFVSVDDILHLCERKQSNGAFTARQRSDILQHFLTLSRVHVTASMPGQGRKQRVTRRIDSAVFEVLGTTIGEYETFTGEVVWEQREVRIGPWVKSAPFSSQTAQLFRRILGYHSQRERYAKRIGRYLTIQFFVQTQQTSQGGLEFSMQELLDQSGIKLDQANPIRTRKMVESAFLQLYHDGIIGSFAQIIPATPDETWRETQQRIGECAKGWWQLYAAQRWRFEPPTSHGLIPTS